MENKILVSKEILKASGKLAMASKDVLTSSAWGLSINLERLDKAIDEYNTLIFEALNSSDLEIGDLVKLTKLGNTEAYPDGNKNFIEAEKQHFVNKFRPKKKP